MADAFDSSPLFSFNAPYVEMLYEKWLENPGSVDASWRELFASVKSGSNGARAAMRPSWSHNVPKFEEDVEPASGKDGAKAAKAKADKGKEAPPHSAAVPSAATRDSIQALMLIRNYRVRGHLMVSYDPLGLEAPLPHEELDPAFYGFTDKDYDRKIFLDGVLGHEFATLREIMDILRTTYCGTMGVEFMHIQYPDQKSWIQKSIESKHGFNYGAEKKKSILHTLIEVDAFEEFLQLKYASTKRFSIQGGDSSIAGLEEVLRAAAEQGVEEINIGMPHRGRMNVITTIMGKPYTELLSLFAGNLDFPEGVDSSGDVKYHLGVSSDRMFGDRKLHLSLASNPSHLEAVDPVVAGKVRAKQDHIGDSDAKDKVMAVLMHGDAAFAGQGVVAETLALADLRGYRTGGTVHIIVNNQIGFTTSPKFSRFTPYPSDVAKTIQAPIFHVNGDDPEAVYFACKTAVEFRQKFKRDVVLDIFCYRKYGHNESDEPMFTQPLMYKAIGKHQSPAKIYAQKLVEEGTVTQEHVDTEYADFRARFEQSFESAKTYKPNKANWLEGYWTGFEKPKGEHPEVDTGVDVATLRDIGTKLSAVPENFAINAKIVRQFEAKRKMLESGEGLDWAMGEALAYGTLLREGYPVRLSGQDSSRGTFSHRHAVLIDQNTEDRYVPLNNIGAQKNFEVVDSSLSEFAILGFEYGYSLAEPMALTLWEAQFGDFANGAQVIIDQFISSGEIKWLRMSGLVMLLPHGYEGMGPEHSSARLERFLQLCGEDNMQVVNCTTPANFFHALRRQLHRKFRKPLVVMTPKSLLRHRLAVSPLAEMAKGTHFQRVIPETHALVDDKKVRRLILTSGKLYYDLIEERDKQGINDTAIVRLEQYYPFPARLVAEQIARYKAAEVVWCQEEPENMGAWRFLQPKLITLMEEAGRKDMRVGYVGRAEAASPAAGYLKIHQREQQDVIETALNLKKPALKKAVG